MPDVMRKFVAAKQREFMEHAQFDLQKRGATENCGMCSFEAKCRERVAKKDSFFCATVQRTIDITDKCSVSKPCQLNFDNEGLCSPPKISGVDLTTSGGDDTFSMLILTLGQLFPFGGLGPEEGPTGGPTTLAAAKGVRSALRNVDLTGLGGLGSDDGDSPVLGVSVDEAYGTGLRRRSRRQTETSGNQGSARKPGSELGFDETVKELVRAITKDMRKELISQWNCIKNKSGDKCLCCCGVYYPDADSETCVEITSLMADYVLGEVKKMTRGNVRRLIYNLVNDLLSGKNS
jgi:hypothetical protein